MLEALGHMRGGKARDDSGVVAEMLKDISASFLEATLKLFNDILVGKLAAPKAWKVSRLVLIFNKGHKKLAGNYRPIAILSTFYNLFSRILCNRLSE